MGKRIIISESEKKNILSLYEETNEYKKENDFLKKYVGKTINEFTDRQLQNLSGTNKIKSIEYNGSGIIIEFLPESSYDYGMYSTYVCKYNPSKLGYEGTFNFGERESWTVYNKTLIDDINQKGTAAGIKWCQKPKADFGTKSINEDTKTIPPPSESIFVANKNPFKYSEYETARRKYSPELKDGDMFYSFDDRRYNRKMFEDMVYKQMIGKSIRIENSDKILKVIDVLQEERYPKTEVEIELRSDDSPRLSSIKLIISKYELKGIYNNNHLMYQEDYSNIMPSLDKFISFVKELIYNYDNDYKNQVVDNNLESIPDEYFKIYKIQRQQTNF